MPIKTIRNVLENFDCLIQKLIWKVKMLRNWQEEWGAEIHFIRLQDLLIIKSKYCKRFWWSGGEILFRYMHQREDRKKSNCVSEVGL